MKPAWTMRYPYLAAILLGLLCTFMTAVGYAVSQIFELQENQSLICIIIALVCSSIIGILMMRKSRFTLPEYGFRQPEHRSSRTVMLYIPLLVMELLPIAVFGFSNEEPPLQYILLLLFTIAVGFNEEIYFRGLAFKFLSEKGITKAIIWSSMIFGVLHLVNAFNGKNIVYLLLQVMFAFLVGIVLAELVSITKSLWLVIIWHALHDYISLLTGDSVNTASVIVLASQVIVLLLYAVLLWRKVRGQVGSLHASKLID